MNKQSSGNLGTLVVAAGVALLVAVIFRMVLITVAAGAAIWLLWVLLA